METTSENPWTPSPRAAPGSHRIPRLSGGMLLLGGAALVAAASLDLGVATGVGYREAVRAADTFEGGAFLAAGVGFLVAGVVVWGSGADRRGRTVGVASALGGGAVLWLAVAGALSVGREGGRLGEGVDVALGPGLYLAVLGGGMVLIGGVLAVLAPRDRPLPAPSWSPQPGPRWTPPPRRDPDPPAHGPPEPRERPWVPGRMEVEEEPLDEPVDGRPGEPREEPEPPPRRAP